MHPNVHSSTIYEINKCSIYGISKCPKCPMTVEWIKKMWYINTLEYHSAIKKNETMPFAATWMDPEIITLSEVSQRKTNIMWYHLYVESKKMIQMNLFTKQKQTHRHRKQTYGYQGERWGGWIKSLGLADTNYYI